jgi:dUTPase
MKILVKKNDSVVIPTRATPDDAGYDLTATSEPEIVGVKLEIPLDSIVAWSRIDYIQYRTSLYIAPQAEDKYRGEHFAIEPKNRLKKFHTLIFPRSSISKKNLVLANSVAVIDSSYRGEILIRFKYITQPEDYIILPEHGRQRIYTLLNPENIYKKGDRIAQIKPEKNMDIEFECVESLDETQRGSGGFGSTN